MNMNHVMALLFISDVATHANNRMELNNSKLSKCICESYHVDMLELALWSGLC